MKVKLLLIKTYYSFPIQLLLLHFRKYQVLLIFWVILFSTINGGFAKVFGGDALYLAPEYLGKVNFYSTTILGLATGMFIMSWQITTFILHTGRFKFLATTSQPFFRYCLNNAIIPLIFIFSMLYRGWEYQRYEQLNTVPDIMLLGEGFICGVLFIFFFCFFYFFNADKNIGRRLEKRFGNPRIRKPPMRSSVIPAQAGIQALKLFRRTNPAILGCFLQSAESSKHAATS